MIYIKAKKEGYYRFGKLIPAGGAEIELSYFKGARPDAVLIAELQKDENIEIKTIDYKSEILSVEAEKEPEPIIVPEVVEKKAAGRPKKAGK